MKRNKFKFKCTVNVITDMDWTKLKESMLQFAEGEVIVRKKIDWDTDQMRKYFHGPVLKFIQEQFKGVGCMYSKDQIKQHLKYEFGPSPASYPNGKLMYIVKSTAEYDFDTYKKFLQDINAWCIECFQCELPPSEQVE